MGTKLLSDRRAVLRAHLQPPHLPPSTISPWRSRHHASQGSPPAPFPSAAPLQLTAPCPGCTCAPRLLHFASILPPDEEPLHCHLARWRHRPRAAQSTSACVTRRPSPASWRRGQGEESPAQPLFGGREGGAAARCLERLPSLPQPGNLKTSKEGREGGGRRKELLNLQRSSGILVSEAPPASLPLK